jgi:hypothetical protein
VAGAQVSTSWKGPPKGWHYHWGQDPSGNPHRTLVRNVKKPAAVKGKPGRPEGSRNKNGGPWKSWQEVLSNPKKFSDVVRRQRLHRFRKCYEEPEGEVYEIPREQFYSPETNTSLLVRLGRKMRIKPKRKRKPARKE